MSIVTFQNIAKRKNQMLHITSVATGKSVSFPAFVESFSDSFDVSWGSEESFGRVDPVKPYRSTSRRIRLDITVLAPNLAKGEENFTQYSKLIQMLYPVYSEPLSAGGSMGRTIKAPPILRIKMMNYIQSADGDGGLLGCINGLSFDPDFNMGHFIRSDGTIVPKKFKISFTFTPQHDSEIGSSPSGDFLSVNFPYGQDQTQLLEEATDSTSPTGQGNISNVLGVGTT